MSLTSVISGIAKGVALNLAKKKVVEVAPTISSSLPKKQFKATVTGRDSSQPTTEQRIAAAMQQPTPKFEGLSISAPIKGERYIDYESSSPSQKALLDKILPPSAKFEGLTIEPLKEGVRYTKLIEPDRNYEDDIIAAAEATITKDVGALIGLNVSKFNPITRKEEVNTGGKLTDLQKVDIKNQLEAFPAKAIAGLVYGGSFNLLDIRESVRPVSFTETGEQLDLHTDSGYVAGAIAGSTAPYGLIAKGVGKVAAAIPQFSKFVAPLAANASKTEVAKRFLFYSGIIGASEEGVDAVLRKATDQEYTSTDFALGMLMGGVFGGVASGLELSSLKSARTAAKTAGFVDEVVKSTPNKAKKTFANMLKDRIDAGVKEITPDVVLELASGVKVSRRKTLKDVIEGTSFFKESRVTALNAFTQTFGTGSLMDRAKFAQYSEYIPQKDVMATIPERKISQELMKQMELSQAPKELENLFDKAVYYRMPDYIYDAAKQVNNAKDLGQFTADELKRMDSLLEAEFSKRKVIVGEIIDKVEARKQLDKEIKEGTFDLFKDSPETLKKVRKSGGLVMDVVSSFEQQTWGKYIGKPIKNAIAQIADGIGRSIKYKDTNLTDFIKEWFTTKGVLNDDQFKVTQQFKKFMARDSALVKSLADGLSNVDPKSFDDAIDYITDARKVNLPDDVKIAADKIKDEILIEGLRLVQNGVLSPDVYFKNYGKYLRRAYEAHKNLSFDPLAEKAMKLKEALMADGKSAEKADDIIAEIAYGNLSSDSKQLMQSSGIKIDDSITKQRKLGNTEVDIAIREFLGEVKDPLYLVQKTLYDMKKTRLMSEYLSELSNVGVAQKTPPPLEDIRNWKKLEPGSGWGSLEGNWIRRDVLNSISGKGNENIFGLSFDGKFWQGLDQVNNFMKANVTSRNPSGQVTNFTSNISNSAAILNINYLSKGGAEDLLDAYRSLSTQDDFYKELMNYGEIGHANITRELGARLNEFVSSKENKEILAKRFWKTLDQKMADMYELGDNVFFMANYKKLRARGLEPVEAISQARRVTPNYDDVPPLLKSLRRSIIGTPFITWRYKVVPEVLKQVLETPISSTSPISIPFMMNYISGQLVDLDKDEKTMTNTKFFRDGEILLPWRNDDGSLTYFDFARYTPYADAFKSKYNKENTLVGSLPGPVQGFAQGWLPGLASFPINIGNNIQNNYDPFLQREIYDEEGSYPEMLTSIMSYLAQPMLPVAGSTLKHTTSYYNRGDSLAAGALRGLTGIKLTSPTVGEFEQDEQIRDPDFRLDTKLSNAIKEVRSIGEDLISAAKGQDKGGVSKAAKALLSILKENPEYEKELAPIIDKAISTASAPVKSDRRKIDAAISTAKSVLKTDSKRGAQMLLDLLEKNPNDTKYIEGKIKDILPN